MIVMENTKFQYRLKAGLMLILVVVVITDLTTTDAMNTSVYPTHILKRNTENSNKFDVLDALWKEWGLYIPGSVKREPEKSWKWFCMPQGHKDHMLVDCTTDLYFHACIGAKTGVIKECMYMDKDDFPIPICREENRIIACHGQHFSSYLCFEQRENVSRKHLVYACDSENLHECLNHKEKFGWCRHSTRNLLQPKTVRMHSNQHTNKRSAYERLQKLLQDPILGIILQELKDINVSSSDIELYLSRIFNYTSRWEEWHSVLSKGNVTRPSTSTLLCMDSEIGKFFQCDEVSSNETACISVQHEELDTCKSFDERDFPYSVCVEESTKKLVTCGHGMMKIPKAYVCSLEEDDASFRPCWDEEDQLCLNRETSNIEHCIDIEHRPSTDPKNHFINQLSVPEELVPIMKIILKIGQAPDNEMRSLLDAYWPSIQKIWSWWADWTLHHGIETGIKSPANSSMLCKDNNKEYKLSKCYNVSSYLNVCVSIYHGEINDCENFNDEDMPLSICIEESSNKLMTCGNVRAFLCKLKGKDHSLSIRPCKVEKHQICLNTNKGNLELCTRSKIQHKRYVEYYDVDAEFWINYWGEWNKPPNDLTVKYPKKEMKELCYSTSEDLIECQENNTKNRVCMSASYSYVGNCMKLKNFEAPIPICLETATNKILTCGGHQPAYLCYPYNEHTKPIRPCHDGSRQICYFQKFFENCHIADFNRGKRRHEMDSQPSTNLTQRNLFPLRFNVPLRFLLSLLSKDSTKKVDIKNAGQITDKVNDLCIDANKVAECKRDTLNQKLCFTIMNGKKGWIGFCKHMLQYMAAPICQQASTNRVMVCGPYVHRFLCYSNDKKSPDINLCEVIGPMGYPICVSRKGRFDFCKKGNGFIGTYKTVTETTRNSSKEKKPSIHGRNTLLCLDIDRKSVYPCAIENDIPPAIACLSTSSFDFKLCAQSVDGSEIALPVCAEDQTTRLKTCYEEPHVKSTTLCLYQENGSRLLKPCNSGSSEICLSKSWKLEVCSAIFEKDFLTDKDLSKFHAFEVMMMKHVMESFHEGIYHLCFSNDRSSLGVCKEDFTDNQACFSPFSGEIVTCIETKPDQMPVPICKKMTNDALMTCGLLNKRNLCERSEYSNRYSVCNTEDQYACVKGGIIEKCIIERWMSRKLSQATAGTESGKGRTKSGKGQTKSGKGQTKSGKGNTKSGKATTKSGKGNTKSGKATTKSGKGNTKSGKATTAHGMATPESGKATTKSGKRNTKSGKATTVYGMATTKSGKATAESGKKKTDTGVTKTGNAKKTAKSLDATPKSADQTAKSEDTMTSSGVGTTKDNMGFKNADNVYKKEKEAIEEMFRSSSPVCVLDSDESVFVVCSEEPHNSEFACFNPEMKEINRCGSYKRTNLTILVCADKADMKISTCGIFHSSPLCFGVSDKIDLCSPNMPPVCLSEGDLFSCEGSFGTGESAETGVSDASEESAATEESAETGVSTAIVESAGTEVSTATEESARTEVSAASQESAATEVSAAIGESAATEGSSVVEESPSNAESPATEQSVATGQSWTTEKQKKKLQGNKCEGNDCESCEEDSFDDIMFSGQIQSNNEIFILKKIIEKRQKAHMFLTHLCIGSKQEKDLVNCDDSDDAEFACIGSMTGNIDQCSNFPNESQEELALPICSMGDDKQLKSCGIFDKMPFCIDIFNNSGLLTCASPDDSKACIGDENQPTACSEAGGSSAELLEGPNEKFMRLHCADCSIENSLVVEGTPNDVLPDAEVMIFKNEQ